MAKAGVADTDEDSDVQDHQGEQWSGSPETCSEDRKEIKPYQADDGRSQSLIDSSQMNLTV